MTNEIILSREYITKDHTERRLDITSDWQVWSDSTIRVDNLHALSAVLIAGYIKNIDDIISPRQLYSSSVSEYNRLVDLDVADTIPELEAADDSRLGVTFNRHLRKLYTNQKSVLRYNMLQITALAPTNYFLLSSDISSSEHLVSVVRGSKLNEEQSVNTTLQNVIMKNLVTRSFVREEDVYEYDNRKVTTKYSPRPTPETITRLNSGIVEVSTRAHKSNKQIDESKKSEQSTPTESEDENADSGSVRNIQEEKLQSAFTNVSDYSAAMIDRIKEIGNEPFDIDMLVDWARDQGFNPNRGEIERIVLLKAAKDSLIKRTNVYSRNREPKSMYVLL